MCMPVAGNVGDHLRNQPTTLAIIQEIPTFRFSLKISENKNILTDFKPYYLKKTKLWAGTECRYHFI